MNALLAYLLQAANVAKKLHWETKSFALHLALDELNGVLIKFTDEIAEEYFGMFGVTQVDVNATQISVASPQAFIAELISTLDQARHLLQDVDSLESTYDALQSAVLKVKYKIDNLQ